MAKKKVLLVIGGMYHPYERCGAIFKRVVEDSGRYVVHVTPDQDVLRPSSIRNYDAVAVYAQGGRLRKEQQSGLLGFVKSGGAFVGLHSATACWQGNAAYIDLIGGKFASHGPVCEFPVTISSRDVFITQRIPDFRITDEFYVLDHFNPDAVEVLARGMWKGKSHPIAYIKRYGEGRVFYLALGHDERAFTHPIFQKLVLRGLDWAVDRRVRKPLKAGVIGYGGQFNMGRLHLEGFRDGAGFEPVAVCEVDAQRRRVAEEEFPGIRTYASVGQLLNKSDAEVVTVITPHDSHARLAVQCADAGRNVIVEKPFCITVKEADAMINAAARNGVMLSVFHNRRWDGDYVTIKDVIGRGLLGEVFHIEQCMSGYGHPGYWWRSHKPISGGAFYDWGAHVVDWVLGLVPSPIREIAGFFQVGRVWHDVTNEDHCEAVVRFENGCCAIIEQSRIAAIHKPRWRVLGTQGALLDLPDKKFKVVSFRDGLRMESEVAYRDSDWLGYYRNIGDHLLLGEALAVTPESARRVIAVIETAERSAKAGKAMPPPRHCR